MENYFSQNLRLIREASGLSQHELAQKLGLKRAVISTYERGVNVPKFETLIKLRSIFKISIDDMILSKIKIELAFKPIDKTKTP